MNKRIFASSLFTILTLSAISLTTLPESHTKFVDKDEKVLVYNAGILDAYKPQKGNITRLPSSTSKTVHLEYSFNRNKDTLSLTTSDNVDTYTVTIPQSCVITDISTRGKHYTDYAISQGKIVYSNSKDDTVKISMSCESSVLLNKDTDVLSTEINVVETIGDLKFNPYMILNYRENASDYPFVKLETIDKLTVVLDDKFTIDHLWTAYKEWVKEYANASGVSTKILDYIGTYENGYGYFKTPGELIDPEKFEARPGISMTKNGEEYTFQIEVNNLVGYAETYAVENGNVLYFSADTKNDINGAFEEYLTHYLYPNDTNTVRAIMKYVNAISPNGVYGMFDKTNPVSIGGIMLNPSTDMKALNIMKDSNADYLKNAALSYVNGHELEFTNSDSTTIKRLALRSVIFALDDNIVSKTLKTSISTDDKVLARSIIKGVNGAFEDYITIYDEENKRDVIFKIYSDGGDKTHMEVSTVDLTNEDTSIVLTNTDTELQIDLSTNPSTELKSLIDDILDNASTDKTLDDVKSDSYVTGVIQNLAENIGAFDLKSVSREINQDGTLSGKYIISLVMTKE